MRHALQAFALLATLLFASSAQAQLLVNDERAELIMSTTSTTTAVVVGVIMLTVVNVRKDPATLNRYLEQNESAVRSAMALGGGTSVEDLAMFFGIAPADNGRFGRALRRARTDLLAAAYETRDPNRFITLVDRAMLLERMR